MRVRLMGKWVPPGLVSGLTRVLEDWHEEERSRRGLVWLGKPSWTFCGGPKVVLCLPQAKYIHPGCKVLVASRGDCNRILCLLVIANQIRGTGQQ